MATRDKYTIKATATPITHKVVHNVDDVKDSFLFEPKVELKLSLTSENLAPPIVVEVRTNKDRGAYALPPYLLKPRPISDTRTLLWRSVSCILREIKSKFPIKMDQVLWEGEKLNQTTSEGHDRFVDVVVQEVSSAGANCSVGGILLTIQIEANLEHDDFVTCIHELDRKARTREVVEECVSEVRSPADSEPVKKSVAKYTNRGLLSRLTEQELKVLLDRVLEKLPASEEVFYDAA